MCFVLIIGRHNWYMCISLFTSFRQKKKDLSQQKGSFQTESHIKILVYKEKIIEMIKLIVIILNIDERKTFKNSQGMLVFLSAGSSFSRSWELLKKKFSKENNCE